tara:strand:+ start:84 stop:437 length:354 start_codon:yes stop_codon:yes gene_type:complete
MTKHRTAAECCCEENKSYNQQSVYQAHTVYIGGTARHVGPFYAITALEDSVIDVSESDTGIIEFASGTKRATTTDITIPKGMTIYSHFASIELDSGKVIAYTKGMAGQTREPEADAS